MRVGADERVRVGDPPAATGGRCVRHDRREVFEIDLVDDAGPGRDHAQVTERRLRPAQELVALAVPLVLALDVEGECSWRPELVDLDGMIDDEISRDEGVHLGRVATEVGHRVAHDRQVDDRRHTGEILEDDAGRHERHLGLGRDARSPRRQRLDVCGLDGRRTFSSRILSVTGARLRSILSPIAARAT